MNNPIENKLTQMAQSVEPSAEFSKELWNQIKMKTPINTELKRSPRRFWIPAAVVLGLLLVLVISAPQTVLAAMRSLLSYIPGVGFVQTGETTLYLSEPVTAEQDGLVLTIDQVVASDEKVVVSYHIDNLTQGSSACFYDDHQLVLPDGTTRYPIGGGAGGDTATVEFAALPQGVTGASLIAGMNFPSEGCMGPQEWNMAFTLGTEAPAEKILPVVENPVAQQPQEMPEGESAVLFNVEKFVELSDGYLLTGHMVAGNKGWRNTIIDMDTISALDANGKTVVIDPSTETFSDNEFSIKVNSKDFVGPITFNVKGLWIFANTDNAEAFTFDAGSNPQTGEKWTVDRKLTVAGQKYTVKDVEMVADDSHTNVPGTLYGYAVRMQGEQFNAIGFDCEGVDGPSSWFGSARPLDNGELSSESLYPDGLPTGVVTCKPGDAQFKATGNWNFVWQP